MNDNKKAFLQGIRDGIPIGLGYFAVAFSLGIMAKKCSLTPIQGFIGSLFTRASAGEYGVYTMVLQDASYLSIVLMSLVTNLRYLLMSTALTQKFDPKESLIMRVLTGSCVTDEIFGISIAYKGYLNPRYPFGATAVAAPLWALGTMTGIIAGSILPSRAVSALSVALYGMFLAIIIPPSKKDKAIMIFVIISFALSYIVRNLEIIKEIGISSGTITIVLTVLISAAAALIKPVKENTAETE
ncbi:MAG: AzlC family ABC transporter permease [Lachnospiraceae bacterium]|nr:AzlC family ABC transporter permease [Lachnospiraceae bacterium]